MNSSGQRKEEGTRGTKSHSRGVLGFSQIRKKGEAFLESLPLLPNVPLLLPQGYCSSSVPPPFAFPQSKGERSTGPSGFLFLLSWGGSASKKPCCFHSGILSPPPGPASSFHECMWERVGGWKIELGDIAPWLDERHCSFLVLTNDTSERGMHANSYYE